jgi:hypothetical protein
MIGAIHGVAIEDADVDALKKGRELGAEDAQGRGISYGEPDKFASSPRREEPAGERQPPQVFRAAVQYRGGTRLQAGTGRLSHGGPGARRAPQERCLAATYVWDTIGAQSAGMAGGLHEAGQCHPAIEGLPQPNLVAPDLPALARKMIDSFQPAPTGVPET